LLTPCYLGKLKIKNKIFMSSMNRCRADKKNCKATPIMQTYYEQRSSAGIIFTEPIYISQEGLTRDFCSGLWNDDQIDGWKRINEKVHERDGVIFATLSHGGRTSHPDINGGITPISPSAVRPDIQIRLKDRLLDAVTPREMTQDDISRVLEDFHKTAIRAKKANFDGISLHASSGSLVECFIKSNTNLRGDYWGHEGGLQFPIEVLKRFKCEFDRQYISIKINPFDKYNDMLEDNPKEKYLKLIDKIHSDTSIELIELKEIIEEGSDYLNSQTKVMSDLFGQEIRKGSKLISNFGTKNINDAINKMEDNTADFVSCATFYVSNPELPEKLKKNIPLQYADPKLFYTNGEEGYIDY
jgi:N-ethylmaleimide reductase